MNQHPTDAKATQSGATELRFDVIAGLTAAAVVLPKAMAYATVAGLPVAVGLYTAFIPMVIYALLGSSRVLSVSSTTTLAILAGTQLGLAVPDGDPAKLVTATTTLTMLVGAMLLLARLLRLGFAANFISVPVLTGFKAGIGLVIVLDQMPKLLGIHIEKQGFFRDLLSVARHVPETSLLTLAVAAATLLVLIGLERRLPHSPAPLVAIGGGIAAAWLFGLQALGVSTVGLIPQGLPSLTMPDLALIEQMVPGALGMALMSFTETIAAGRAFARPDDPPIDANRELIATGVANLGGALFGAMPAGGGTSQTAIVRAAGGRSQKASLVTAGTAAATMLLLAPLLALLPNATLAAVVIVYSVGLIQPLEFLAIRKVRTMEFRWAIIAAVGVLLFGTLKGIVVAIIASLIGLASQVAYPRVSVIGRKRGADVLRPLSPEHPDDETFEGLLIVRPEGRVFFVNAQYVAEQIGALVAQHKPRVLAVDMSRVPDIEYSALQMLIESDKRAIERGAIVWLAGLNPGALKVVRNARLDERLGRARMLFNARAVIKRYQALQPKPGVVSTEGGEYATPYEGLRGGFRMSKDANTFKIVGLLVEAANTDTVYRDVHLRRARELLGSTLNESAYRAIGSTEKEIDDLVRRSRSAVLQRDWAQTAELSGQIDSMRQRLAKMGKLSNVGKEVYEAETVVFEPFSPGKYLAANAQASQAGQRTQAIDGFASLAKLDAGASAFYEKRRSYFSGLEVKSAAVSQKGAKRDRAQAEKLAMEAAERGDTAALQRLAKELRDWKESETAVTPGSAPVMLNRYECPVDLAAAFPAQAIERARELGFVGARTTPYAEFAKVREVIYTHVDQPVPSNPDMEREGVLRARAMAEKELPTGLDTEESRVLAGQFIQQIFINSAGVRYLPPLGSETVLLEDFAENESAEAPSKLLTALKLSKRSGLSRTEIESSLMRFGSDILANTLGLDPAEYRLICIPYDVYVRAGRDGRFGKWHHWTHFDGYQVMAGNRLRALTGGDGRFGGLYDLVSISPSDARDGVYARFAVVRRARMTLRWR